MLLVARRVRIGPGDHQRHVGDAGGRREPFSAVEDVELVPVLDGGGVLSRWRWRRRPSRSSRTDPLVTDEQGFKEFFFLIFGAVGEDRNHPGVIGPRVFIESAPSMLSPSPTCTSALASGPSPMPRYPSALTDTTGHGRGPSSAAGRAPRQAVWCRVPFPWEWIPRTPIRGLSCGSPWLPPESLSDRHGWVFLCSGRARDWKGRAMAYIPERASGNDKQSRSSPRHPPRRTGEYAGGVGIRRAAVTGWVFALQR